MCVRSGSLLEDDLLARRIFFARDVTIEPDGRDVAAPDERDVIGIDVRLTFDILS